jgi:hypothetical protein
MVQVRGSLELFYSFRWNCGARGVAAMLRWNRRRTPGRAERESNFQRTASGRTLRREPLRSASSMTKAPILLLSSQGYLQ